MRLQSCYVCNFGSYATFGFDFNNLGLALIYGKTGAGKSTIADMVSWILFGVTAKDGAVDDVRSWTHMGEPTAGSLTVMVGSSFISVHRIRGTQSENDLYWTDGEGPPRRGKDMTETQKFIEQRLGVTPELYAIGAYFHEFSPAGSFFTAKAKQRRELFEQLANLSLPVNLAEKTQNEKKKAKIEISAANISLAALDAKLEQLRKSHANASTSRDRWDANQNELIQEIKNKVSGFDKAKAGQIADLRRKRDSFESGRQMTVAALKLQASNCRTLIESFGTNYHEQIMALRDKISKLGMDACPTCKTPRSHVQRAQYEKQIADILQQQNERSNRANELTAILTKLRTEESAVNPFDAQVESAQASVNNFSELLAAEEGKINPFTPTLVQIAQDIKTAQDEQKKVTKQFKAANARYVSLDTLYDLSSVLRAKLLEQVTCEIENLTNSYLLKHFDSELSVQFAVDNSDNLQVVIQKSGYECSYKQLSKGQRGLLKLTFGLAIMKAASDKAGVFFDTLFFDEALDGLDSELKVKAFSLFEELGKSHNSVMLVEHATEFQNLFETKLHVEMCDEQSYVHINE